MPFSKIHRNISSVLEAPVHIAPLVVLRVLFGLAMLLSIVRFALQGWIEQLYINPRFHFPFYGFEWLSPLPGMGMYVVFALMAIAACLIMLGWYYRLATITFFLCFTYTELLDKSYYLNHYYFVSIVALFLIFVPANRYYSLDCRMQPSLEVTMVPAWTVWIFKIQLCILYFYAGLAKVNYDWLMEALPLRIWLPAKSTLPFIGSYLKEDWVAYAFSWCGMLYDLLIWIFLLYRPSRNLAYVLVIIFHGLTAIIFPHIGVFPYVMVLLTIIFLSEKVHLSILRFIQKIFRNLPDPSAMGITWQLSESRIRVLTIVLGIHLFIQVLLPLRYLLYPNKLSWTEQGFRFSWRVMLIEKAGTAFFYVSDPETGIKTEIINSHYLTPLQEKMMSTQADMMLQFAHFLDKEYRSKGMQDPVVTVDSYVTLNGSGSRRFIDASVDLSREEDSFANKSWILPFDSKQD